MAQIPAPVTADTVQAEPSYAIVDVSVLPMDRDTVLRHQTVLIVGEKISAILPAATAHLSEKIKVLSGRGRFLLPGLADMHQHFLRSPERGRKMELVFAEADRMNELFGLLAIANGVTTVRNLWGQAAIDRVTGRFVTGDLLGPTVYSSGPITDGDPPRIVGARIAATPQQGRDAVREDKIHGRSGVKVYDKLKLSVYDAIVDEAHRQGLPVWGHLPFAVPLEHAIAARQASIEHVSSLIAPLQANPADADRLTELELVRKAEPRRLLRYAAGMKAAGIWFCPTIAVDQIDWPAGTSAPGMRYLPPRFMEHYGDRWAGSSTSGRGDEEIRLDLQVVKLLHAQGVRILAGSDALKRNVVPGFALIAELRYLVQAGLTPYEALRAATYDAARFLHREREFGTIMVGSRADLLLLNGDPLQNIANVSLRAGVMVRGRWFSNAELQTKLVRSSRKNRLISSRN